MTPFMIWMAKTCKGDAFALNLLVTHATDVAVSAAVVVAAEEEEAAVVAADLVETRPDQGPTTDWSWRTCLLAHLGRI